MRREHVDAFGSHPHLRGRFFAGDVQRATVFAGVVRRRLKQQGRFAHARLAGEQHDCARHEAAAECAVEFVDAGCAGAGLVGVDLADGFRRCRHRAS